MTKTYHMSMNIAGCLRNGQFNGFTNDDGSSATPKQVKAFLNELLTKGHRIIPLAECDAFDPVTGCPGHEQAPLSHGQKGEG